jgi:acyl carrier protein
LTEAEIRQVISDALSYASVPLYTGSSEEADFVAGRRDIRMDQFDIDSLAAMELCIAIEANLGVEIAPAELEKITTLGGIVKLAQKRARR